jgi:PAS domain S-box-containing protein
VQEMTGKDGWFRLVVEGMPNAMLVTRRDGCLALVNRRAEEMFGYAPGELAGRALDLLIPERHRASHAELVADVFLDPVVRGTRSHRPVVGRHKDGHDIPIEVGISPILTAEGPFSVASVLDVTARRKGEEAEQEMAALVQSAEDAIITKSLDGIIRSWNPGAERLLGYRAEEIVGRSIQELIPDDRRSEEAMILEQLSRGQRVAHFETVRRRKDGTLVTVSLTISPILDREGRVMGASKIMRDISERKRAEAALHQSYADLAATNKELDEFVYTASHDLRSPLIAVSRLANWTLEDDETLTGETRRRLELMQGRLRRMTRLLDDIRDYARAGRYAEPSGPRSSAAKLVADILATTDVPDGFRVDIDPSLESVEVTRVPLEQVFLNLITNAVKHHDRSTGVVVVSAVDLGRRLHRFSVQDDGPGIPESYRHTVFEMFSTLRPRDAVEGSGMGLALVKKIVTRFGGTCGVTQNDARGACVWFDWPTLSLKVPG